MTKKIGIYQIFNKLDGKRYIGSSSNITHRIQVHKTCLRGGYHDNPYLQNAWDKYGETNFEFSILETCNDSELIVKEKQFIDQHKSNQRSHGYNIGDCVISPMKGRKHSASTRLKISQKNKGKNNPRFGITVDNKTKEKISKSLVDYFKTHQMIVSAETRKKISDAQTGNKNHMFGKVGEKHHRSQKVVKLSMNGELLETYFSLHQASVKNNLSPGNLSRCCSGRLKSLGGFRWQKIA